MVFVADEEDEEDDEDEVIEYRHIPKDEMLPTTVLAPCMEKLLGLPLTLKQETSKSKSGEKASAEEKKPENKDDIQQTSKEDQGLEVDEKNKGETENKKSKSARRRERQKQKKMMLMQGAPSPNDDAKMKDQIKKEKQARSEYFRIHGKLPS